MKTTVTCEEVYRVLADYPDLDRDEDTEAIFRHLETCPACRRRAEEFAYVDQFFTVFEARPLPERIRRRAEERIRSATG